MPSEGGGGGGAGAWSGRSSADHLLTLDTSASASTYAPHSESHPISVPILASNFLLPFFCFVLPLAHALNLNPNLDPSTAKTTPPRGAAITTRREWGEW